MYSENWVPVNTCSYPNDKEPVQVTFLGYEDKEPYCDAFAYRDDGEWYWTLDESNCEVKITAWKSNCEPYRQE